MDTKAWGPHIWHALFFIACGYPETLDLKDDDDYQKMMEYQQFFRALGNVLPCKYCRESYTGFFNDLFNENPEKGYFDNRAGLLRFVYDLKELVNTKLRKQEDELFTQKFKELAAQNLPEDQFVDAVRKITDEVFFTKPTPDFHEVVDTYERHRASCNKTLKTCRRPSIDTGIGQGLLPPKNHVMIPTLEGGGSTVVRKRNVARNSTKRRGRTTTAKKSKQKNTRKKSTRKSTQKKSIGRRKSGVILLPQKKSAGRQRVSANGISWSKVRR